MTLSNIALQIYLRLRQPRIKRLSKYPIKVQNRTFYNLIHQAQNTEIGKKYDFKSIKDPKTFAERLPIGDYETHKEAITRMMHGESDVLWKGKIEWFSKSSGTTHDKSKFLPVSTEGLDQCFIQGPKDSMTLFYMAHPNATVFDGKGVIMGGAYEHFKPYPQSKFGDVSSIMIDHIPMLPKTLFYTPPMEIALMREWEDKIQTMAEYIINDNVTNIGGVPTWTIVLFRKMLEITGKDNILEIWPNFQVYFHGAVSFEPYRAQFREFFPSDQVKYFEVYNASEGYFAIGTENNSDEMLLLIDSGIYYEFIPSEELKKDEPKAIPLSEVELNKNYALVISTNNGLWRYNLGDTVMITSRTPYKIRVTGRTAQHINVFGEEVMVSNTDLALGMTCEEMDVLVKDYTVAPIFLANHEEGKGGHEWLIEFEKEPIDIDKFEYLLDKNLQGINSDYEAKRYKGMVLQQLRVHVASKETFNNWLKMKGKFGRQSKIPRLANHRKYLDEMMALNVKY
jgi:hypothetical protein